MASVSGPCTKGASSVGSSDLSLPASLPARTPHSSSAGGSWIAESGGNPNPEDNLSAASPSLSEQVGEKRKFILVVEDNESDIYLIRDALTSAQVDASVRVLRDGDAATSFFDELDRNPMAVCPALILLDINLPRTNGDQVLAHLKKSVRCRNARVIVVTSSDSQRDRQKVRELGADAYFRKPSDYEEFLKLGTLIKTLL
jgi:CheY-like chemotaxis protein